MGHPARPLDDAKVIGRGGTLRNGRLALAVRLAPQTAGRTLGIEVSGEDANGGSERRRLATRLRVER